MQNITCGWAVLSLEMGTCGNGSITVLFTSGLSIHNKSGACTIVCLTRSLDPFLYLQIGFIKHLDETVHYYHYELSLFLF